jgi:hypothetical protein
VAQLATSFTDETRVGDGVVLGFTLRWGEDGNTVDLTEPGDNNVGPMVFELSTDNFVSSNVGPLATWDLLDLTTFASADVDLLVLWRYTNDNGVPGKRGVVAARASGARTAENGYLVYADNSDNFILAEVSAGTVSTLVSTSLDPVLVSTWYWTQLRVVGTSLKARIWAYGAQAPSQWTLETTNATHTAAGWAGIGHDKSEVHEFDFLSVGTDGDVAQLPASAVAGAVELRCDPSTVQADADGFLNFYGPANVAVSWAISVGDGSIAVLDTKTDASGRARAIYTPGTVDTTITVQVTYGT